MKLNPKMKSDEVLNHLLMVKNWLYWLTVHLYNRHYYMSF